MIIDFGDIGIIYRLSGDMVGMWLYRSKGYWMLSRDSVELMCLWMCMIKNFIDVIIEK